MAARAVSDDPAPQVSRVPSATRAAPRTAPSIVSEVLASPGQPLDPQTRSYFEPRFGVDFSSVRVHDDARAADSAVAVNATAYAVGSNGVLGREAPPAHTDAGRRLMAHELTHVVQQSGHEPVVQRQAVPTAPSSDPAAEEDWKIEADEAARRVAESKTMDDRALAERLSLPLNVTKPERFIDEDDAVDFIDKCHQDAVSEDVTLQAAIGNSGLSKLDVLETVDGGFPNTWATKVDQDFHIYDARVIEELRRKLEARKADANEIVGSIAGTLWQRGFPITLAEARDIGQFDILPLVLGRKRLSSRPRK